MIVAGNGMFAAAQALGWKSIDVVRTKLRGAEARAFAISNNRTAELAEWDPEELSRQLDELGEVGISAADLSFSEAELDAMLRDVAGGSGDEKKSGGKATAAAGGGAAVVDQRKVVITCRDEMHQTDVLDAIDNVQGERLGELLKGCDCRALVG